MTTPAVKPQIPRGTGEIYRGLRVSSGAHVYVDPPAGAPSRCSPLPVRTDLVNHSPDGFEWGYQGAGPAQLALALLSRATGDDDVALAFYEDFLREIVASLRLTSWTLTQQDIMVWTMGREGGRS